MQRPFFPDYYFGWTFYAVLVCLCVIGAYLDLRKAVLPKSLTLTALALGFVFNIVRGAWLGGQGNPLVLRWESLALPTGSVGMGALYGFLFALAGFLLTAILFFCLWALKTCGGGDVKLFAALGAWVGFHDAVLIMLASVLVLMVLLVIRLLTEGGPGKGKWRMTYAFPVAVGTALLLLWSYRVDLQLTAPKGQPEHAARGVSP